MFSYLKGKIATISENSVTLDVQGVGFAFQVPSPEFFQGKQEVSIPVHMHWNSDNGPSLYGFSSELERTVFLLIISCSGLGPKIGLAVLHQLSPGSFLQAIQEGDDKALSSVSGIGAKKAEQIIVQLRHKVTKLIESGVALGQGTQESLEQWKNLTQVLQSLSYSRQEIEGTLTYLRKEGVGATAPFDALMRQALSFLAKKV
ncbi:MAG: Holliday junction DNA helicase RuvA [Alteromonas naphthalenivorans]|jgi:Holliday junction DNA helicase RuvA